MKLEGNSKESPETRRGELIEMKEGASEMGNKVKNV